ncbi:MAG: TIGR03118 family protein [Gammaproteobacteria bacterium]
MKTKLVFIASALSLGLVLSLPAQAIVYTTTNEVDGNRVIAFDADREGSPLEIGSFDTQGRGTGAPIGNQAALPTDASDRALFSAADEAHHGSIQYDWFPGVKQTNLVANKPEFGAQILEPDLKNAWGIAIRPAGLGGHFWVAAERTGKSIEYVGDVGDTPLFQDDLRIVDTLGAPTGVVFNPGTQFVITQPHEDGAITNAAKFLFANASGTITAWTERPRADGGFDRPGDSVIVVDGTARFSAFLGVAVSPAADLMYAADFGAEPAVRVYDGAFVELEAFANPFNAQNKPDGFEAFNVQTIGESVFAMYGRHVPPDAVQPAQGRLAEFDADGRLIAKWRGRGYLNFPWGVALAPKDFGFYGGCLLVGNFGDGTIVAFHPRHKVALDYVRDEHWKRVVIDGLWGLQFGNGASLGEANHMYFAAGPNKETDGLFGKLEPNPNTLRALRGISLCR